MGFFVCCQKSSLCLRSISGWIITYHGTPVTWGCIRHKDIAQSSYQAGVHSINEATKILLSLKLFFHDITLPITLPITDPIHINNDNQGAVLRPKGTTTKK